MQNIYNLPYQTGLKLTIQKYFTPSGKSIHGKGIKPDIEIKSLTPTDDEKFYLKKMNKNKLITNFVKTNPEGYTKQNIAKFQQLLKQKKYPIRPIVAELLLKSKSKNGKKKELVNLKFDLQLAKAVNSLK